jgi:hypothetical protein
MIRLCSHLDFEDIWNTINDGAEAYKGVIPADSWHEPYMTREKLAREIEEGVVFWGFVEQGALQGVMGIQDERASSRHRRHAAFPSTNTHLSPRSDRNLG